MLFIAGNPARFPSSALLPFFAEGSLTKMDYRKRVPFMYPYSNLSTGGPSLLKWTFGCFADRGHNIIQLGVKGSVFQHHLKVYSGSLTYPRGPSRDLDRERNRERHCAARLQFPPVDIRCCRCSHIFHGTSSRRDGARFP